MIKFKLGGYISLFRRLFLHAVYGNRECAQWFALLKFEQKKMESVTFVFNVIFRLNLRSPPPPRYAHSAT